MEREEILTAVDLKLTALREKATCRCDAVNVKVNKVIQRGEDHEPDPFYACCWVCCDCFRDRMDGEL